MALQVRNNHVNSALRNAVALYNNGDADGAMKLCDAYLPKDLVQKIVNKELTVLEAVNELTNPKWSHSQLGINNQTLEHLSLSDCAEVAQVNQRCNSLFKKFKPYAFTDYRPFFKFINHKTGLSPDFHSIDQLAEKFKKVENFAKIQPYFQKVRSLEVSNTMACFLDQLDETWLAQLCPNLEKWTSYTSGWNGGLKRASKFPNLRELTLLTPWRKNDIYEGAPLYNVVTLNLNSFDSVDLPPYAIETIIRCFPMLQVLNIRTTATNYKNKVQHTTIYQNMNVLHESRPDLKIYYDFTRLLDKACESLDTFSTLNFGPNNYAFAQFALDFFQRDPEVARAYLERHFQTSETQEFNVQLDQIIEFARKNPVTAPQADALLKLRK